MLEAKGANLVGDDQDNVVMALATTVRKRLQGSNFSNVDVILASARSMELMGEAEQQIRQLLLERHRFHPASALTSKSKTPPRSPTSSAQSPAR